ncbi:hypothetical protein CCR94_17180 [Rhodoblastus sphagnicola]|uniref:AAA+ ATPase domain-containing protein n=1 Tax=Rhodoblastus sphagnicola TaxID=333368 RepID=A0A2S6N211_9HYPH|nr:AAA family ATPase [Rhodoblastus sphagnicola]MBB4199715.1 MoxR-like ATPase [Rhodoblastus sphagnicola]PPQ28655.1 hypothetical protein CCR94_17180 [Rhodoblastus sphagnicola]
MNSIKRPSKTTKAATAKPVRPSVALYNDGELAALIHAAEIAAGNTELGGTQSEEARRLASLKDIAGSFIGPERALLLADDGMIRDLRRLLEAAPNLSPLVELFLREALSSQRTGTPLMMPPIVLLGPPGVGKTHVARRLARALGTAFVPIEMSLLDDIGDLSGHTLSWKSARPGVIARTLLDEPWASPLILLDEIEKAPKYSHSQRPLDLFHALFEPESASRFRDQYLRLELRADHIFWIATANSIDSIPTTIVDRCLIVRIDRPSPAEGREIAEALFRSFAADRPGIAGHPTRAILDVLARHSPRHVRRILHIAAGFAAARDATALTVVDLEAAAAVVGAGAAPEPHRIGFL